MTSTVFWKYAPGASTGQHKARPHVRKTAHRPLPESRADASGVTVGYSGVAARIAPFISSVSAIRLRRAFSPITRT